MNGYKVGFYVMSALFAASLAVQLLDRGETSPDAETGPTASAAPIGSVAAPTESEPMVDVAALRRDLAACRESSWELLQRIISAQVHGDDPAAAADNDADLQRQALTKVALTNLRQQFKQNREPLLATMRYVGTEEFIEADIDLKVEAHRKRFDLNEAQAARLRDQYGDLWGDYGADMQRLIKAEDWEGLMDEVRSFWSDEDRMVGSVLGQDQRDTYRAADAPGRTAIMAILATFADKPWDESMRW